MVRREFNKLLAAAVAGLVAGGSLVGCNSSKKSDADTSKGSTTAPTSAPAKHACKGMNACKGQGYVSLSKAECDAAKAEMKK